jgi:hypothetical protein
MNQEHPIKFLIWNTASRILPLSQGQKIVGSCTGCGNCCRISNCKFLSEADGKSLCTIYNHPLRKFLNCDAYPANRRAIEMVNCPGFKSLKTED